jgi:hypothetical protein
MLNFDSALKQMAVVISIVGIGISTSACVVASNDMDPDLDMDPGTIYHPTGELDTMNGGGPDDYHGTASAQWMAMNMPLTSDGKYVAKALNDVGLPTSPPGERIFNYITRCALPSDRHVVSPDSSKEIREFRGGGILALRTDWTRAPLREEEMNALQECLLAHLNPNGSELIMMKGAVVNDRADITPEWQREAVWLVKWDAATESFIRKVYAMPDFYDSVSTMRVCGSMAADPELCDVEIIKNEQQFHAECIESPPGSDQFSCLGEPAITTFVL